MTSPPGARVRVYRRASCHLCDAAEAAIAPVARRFGLSIERVDIESDDALLQRYMFEIPVVMLDGNPVGAAPMSARAIADALLEALGG